MSGEIDCRLPTRQLYNVVHIHAVQVVNPFQRSTAVLKVIGMPVEATIKAQLRPIKITKESAINFLNLYSYTEYYIKI